ncbi:hypothetical protein EMIHUDRAFT_210857 [Emiliania huxleyi CCMP1516]|uniref:Uncharacterized protein n=2 Tax=Emiliania huxleyi TaxID=2903 RepID=A0A0D3IXE2_EMIH1|nr:hypothetical protein EMIHUDRAFT_210857 [Emiliania huxleyi CCMP1516]EOD15927.1 hypothetical protein EMIHUDRAFT_210857 [Emiliania huxleyi CCMP1516]|eukprot:XP_005768356.1 hypothetical protein EMIHUDRAFT_210857 [Emiliania huxleyi CCMP1516]
MHLRATALTVSKANHGRGRDPDSVPKHFLSQPICHGQIGRMRRKGAQRNLVFDRALPAPPPAEPPPLGKLRGLEHNRPHAAAERRAVQQSCNRAATAIPGDGVQAGAGQAAALQLGAEHALTRPSHPQPRPLASQKGMHAGARPARAQPQPQQTMASIGWTVAGAGPAVAAGGGAVAGGGLEAAWVMGVPVTTGAPIETDVDVIGTPTAMAEVSIAIGGCPCQHS